MVVCLFWGLGACGGRVWGAPTSRLTETFADVKAKLAGGQQANIVVVGDSLSFRDGSYLPVWRRSVGPVAGCGRTVGWRRWRCAWIVLQLGHLGAICGGAPSRILRHISVLYDQKLFMQRGVSDQGVA